MTLVMDDWNEGDHPRAENGEFGEGGGGNIKESSLKGGERVEAQAAKAGNAKESLKGGEGVEAHGGDAKAAKALILGFRRNVFDEKGVEFKGAVAKVFKLPIEQDKDRIARLMQSEEKKKAFRDPKKSGLQGARDVVDRRLAKGADAYAKTVEAISKTSQDAYGSAELVTVYRGITGVQAKEIIDAHSAGKDINVRVDTTSSFTSDYKIAKGFSRFGATRSKASSFAVVIGVQVSKRCIVASHVAFKELDKEKEVIIATNGGFTIPAGSGSIKIISGGG